MSPTDRFVEHFAVTITVLGIGASTWLPLYYEARLAAGSRPTGARTVTLTALSALGIWTDQEVTAANYWRHDFRPARPVLRVGKPVLLRLKSADVTHRFYVPELGIGPLEVAPGHVAELHLNPRSDGTFPFFCMGPGLCGIEHFRMRGEIVVRGDVGKEADGDREIGVPDIDEYWRLPPPPAGATRTEYGRWLFRQKGCFSCHGPDGRGQVRNWNAVGETVPALDDLAGKMFLFDPEDVRTVVSELERGASLDELEESAPVPRYSAVLAQYHSIRDVIKAGREPGQQDSNLPPPPLEMPAWSDRLSDDEIDAIITYLLTLRLAQQP